MKAVAEAAWLQAPAPQSPRAAPRDRQNDFSRFMNHVDQQSARIADRGPRAATQDDAATADAATADAAAADAAQQDAADEAAKQDEAAKAHDENLAWLASQMLAYKVKLPMQQGSGEGSDGPVQTTIVTLPASFAAAGMAPPAPGQTGGLDDASLRALLGGQLPDSTAAQPLPADPTVPTTPVVTDPDVTPVPVDPAPVDPTAVSPVSVDPLPTPPVTDPAVPVTASDPLPQDPAPPVVTETPPTDPQVIVAATDPTPPTETDPQTTVADADPPAVDGPDATNGGGKGAAMSAGRASVVAASTNAQASGFSGNGADAQSSDPQSGERTAGVNQMTAQSAAAASLMAPAQAQLAVPADNQLAPTLGIEIASTVQGMSALDRVLQATDQSQSATPMLKVLNVQLAPPDLGNVSVRLSLEGNALDVHMSVDQGRTRTLIERDRHLIADSLSRVGYSVSTLTVEQASSTGDSNMSSAGQSFSSNNSFDGSSGRQSNGAGGFSRSPNDSGRWANLMEGDGGSAPAPAARPAARGVFI